ncbi:hypothetical protein GF351_00370 [Candidatus Woesearchaeota archaeon]|nr:hypothetical protein [Candidatus Woesearchaeota archaeon]
MRLNLGRRIEDLIIAGIIILTVLDFMKWLPGDLDYIKKIISWTLLGYLMYRVSITRVLFGTDPERYIDRKIRMRDKHLDVIIILTYFLFIIKNLVNVAYSSSEEVFYFRSFYNLIIANTHMLESYTFIAGGILLFALSIYLALRADIRKPSLLAVLGQEGKLRKGPAQAAARTLVIWAAFVGFYVIVFNLVMEWLAIVTDAPLVMLAIFFYSFIIVRYKQKFKAENLLFKIANVGEKFYEDFINLFRSRKKVWVAISGMLVLHLLADIAAFIIPYTFGMHDLLYFEHFKTGHTALIYLMIEDLAVMPDIVAKISVVLVYVLNLAAMLFLLVMPGFIWYNIYRNRGFRFPAVLLGLFFASVVCFGYTPVFSVTPLESEGLVGVDILTRTIFDETVGLTTLYVSAAGSMIAFLAVYLAGKVKAVKHWFIGLSILIVDMFFGFYIYHYASTMTRYYTSVIPNMFLQQSYIIAFYLSAFMLFSLLFYASGFVAFLIETKNEYRLLK